MNTLTNLFHKYMCVCVYIHKIDNFNKNDEKQDYRPK